MFKRISDTAGETITFEFEDETIFAWPGMGRLGFEAILARDFPVILTLTFFSAILVLLGTLISDILYGVADPRIKF